MSKRLVVLLLALMGALCGSRDASIASVSQATAYPFNPNPFTVAICATDPCSPKLAPNSAAIIAHMMPCSECVNMGMVSIPVHVAPPSYGGDSTFPIYYAKATDSNYAISCSTSYTGHVCSSWNPSTINVPDGASGSCTRDHHAILIEPDGREYEFGHFNNGRAWIGDCTPISGGGTLYVGHNGICTITAFANGGVCKGSGVASGMPVIDTLLNPQELLEGAVTHELSAAGNCPSNTWQWPAHQSDGKCPGVGIPEGGIVWLDLSFAQIDSLPGHYNWDRTILRYLHKYGLRIVDSTKKNPNVPWSYYSYDDKSATAPLWTSWFTEVSKECPTCKIRWGRGASHLWLPTAGLTQSNFHVLAPP